FTAMGSTGVSQVKAAEVVQQQQVVLNNEEVAQLKRNLTELGIDDKTQNELIDKYNKGEIWDSMNPNKIKQVTSNLKLTAKNPVQKFTFPDGSVLQVKATVLNEKVINTKQNINEILPASSKECGSGYCKVYDVLVDGTSGVQSAEFRADFVHVQGGYDYISEIYDWRIVVIGGSYSLNEFTINRPKEDKRRSAQATLKWTMTTIGGAGGATSYLRLHVQNDDWSVEGSM
ncbi:hypothetical protein, partial [Brevibacillus fortis]